MAQFKLSYNATTKEARIQLVATAVPAGFVAVGNFNHSQDGTGSDDANDALHFHNNHAVYHHVRGMLQRSAPLDLSKQNMQSIKITTDAGITIASPNP